MPYIRETIVSQNRKVEAKAIGVIAGLNVKSLAGVQIVDPVTLPKNARHTAKNVFTATRKDILASFVVPSIVASLLDQM